MYRHLAYSPLFLSLKQRTTLWLPKKIKNPLNQMIRGYFLYSKRDLNPHSRNGQGILSPSCLPFHHSSILSGRGRAENEARTRDPNLGKVMLYQLSYFRIFEGCFLNSAAKIGQILNTAKFFCLFLWRIGKFVGFIRRLCSIFFMLTKKQPHRKKSIFWILPRNSYFYTPESYIELT